MRSTVIAVTVFALSACQPPAADKYVERVSFSDTGGQARAPVPSPDTEGAAWVASGEANRIVYGKPSSAPLLALACETGEGGQSLVRFTRFAQTDKGAKALMALIGNGHRSRLKVDAVYTGKAWLWQGVYPAADPLLEALTGRGSLEATVPGAGTVKIAASPLPGRLVEACRAGSRVRFEEEPPLGEEIIPDEDPTAPE